MAARSIASLSITFGLVSIPVKLYSATESSAAIRFKLMASSGARVRQQYVTDGPPPADVDGDEPEAAERGAAGPASPAPSTPAPRLAASSVLAFPSSRQDAPAPSPWPMPTQEPAAAPAASVVERTAMVKGYEFEKGRFVLFTADELKALEEGSRPTIDIVAFAPERSVDPIYYDKAYFLAPDKRGAKPYHLLRRALRDTGHCALAKWAFRAKEYVVQIRAAEGGLVLQQLLYAEEVRSLDDLHIEPAEVGEAELELARQLIEQSSVEAYDPTAFVDEERRRILAAVEKKIAGWLIVAPERAPPGGGQVVDLVEALRASLRPPEVLAKASERRPVKRAPRPPTDAAATVPAASPGGRSRKR